MNQFNFLSNNLSCKYVVLSTMKDLPTNRVVQMHGPLILFDLYDNSSS